MISGLYVYPCTYNTIDPELTTPWQVYSIHPRLVSRRSRLLRAVLAERSHLEGRGLATGPHRRLTAARGVRETSQRAPRGRMHPRHTTTALRPRHPQPLSQPDPVPVRQSAPVGRLAVHCQGERSRNCCLATSNIDYEYQKLDTDFSSRIRVPVDWSSDLGGSIEELCRP